MTAAAAARKREGERDRETILTERLDRYNLPFRLKSSQTGNGNAYRRADVPTFLLYASSLITSRAAVKK